MVGAGHEGGEARLETHGPEKVALGERRPGPAAAFFERLRQGGEIDMGGDVALAGILGDGGKAMAAQRLQGIARRRHEMAIVDDEGSALLPRQPFADGAGYPRPGGGGFDDVAHAAGRGRRPRGGGDRDDRKPPVGQADRPLAPAAFLPGELADRQGVEELVGDEHERTFGNGVEGPVPVGVIADPFSLEGFKPGARLDEMDTRRLPEGGRNGAGPQQVRHQRSPPGPKLDQAEGGGLAHGLPLADAPDSDEFAEDLGDFRRGDEVASLAEGLPRHVIAMGGMAEAEVHVAVDRHRPPGRDLGADQALKGRHAGPVPEARCRPRREAATAPCPW